MAARGVVGDAGNRNAIDQLWRLWTEEPADESWQCLARWREPAELLGAVFTMAMNPRLSRTTREPVLNFCRRHGLVPADPVDCALYSCSPAGRTSPKRSIRTVGTEIGIGPVRVSVADDAIALGTIEP